MVNAVAGVGEPYRVLGLFRPSVLDPAAIELELPAVLRQLGAPGCCLSGRLGIRVPSAGVQKLAGNLVWHQDEGPGHMIVWASEAPTELELSDGRPWAAKPFEVLWFDNRAIRHRQPADTPDLTRWFLAIRCAG